VFDQLSNAELLSIYNTHAPKPAVRFESRKIGESRTFKVLQAKGLTIEDVVAPAADDEPAADAASEAYFNEVEAMAEIAERSAAVAAECIARKMETNDMAKKAAAEPAKAPAVEIAVRYSAVDGFSKSRTFKTLAGARKFAQGYVGAHPEIGLGYAVAGDGVGKVTVRGCKLAALFGEDVAPAAAPETVRVEAMLMAPDAVADTVARMAAEVIAKTPKAKKAVAKAADEAIEAKIVAAGLTGKKLALFRMMLRKDGVSEAEGCSELAWAQCSATMFRVYKAAEAVGFVMSKWKGTDGKMRYGAAL
jgi:hypothetical protein